MQKFLLPLVLAVCAPALTHAEITFKVNSAAQDGTHLNLTGDEVNTYRLRTGYDYSPWFSNWTSAEDCFGISVNIEQAMTSGSRLRETQGGIGLWNDKNDAVATYTLTVMSGLEDYCVSGYSYVATPLIDGLTFNGESITKAGKTVSVSNLPAADTFTLTFTTKGATSSRVDLTDFTITLARRHAAPVTYTIDAAEGDHLNKSNNEVENTTWFKYWKSVEKNGIKLYFGHSSGTADSPLRMISDVQKIGIGINALTAELGFTFSLLEGEDRYYVSDYTYHAATAANGGTATLNGKDVNNEGFTVSEHNLPETSTPFSRTLTTKLTGNTNTRIDLTDFVLTLTPRLVAEDYAAVYKKVLALADDAIAKADEYAGTGIGQYAEAAQWKAAIQTAYAAVNAAYQANVFVADDFEAACQNLADAIAARPDVNAVAPGQYIRIKSNTSGRYFAFGDGAASHKAESDAESILYYDSNRHLSGYINGRIALKGAYHLGEKMTATEQNADDSRTANAAAWAVDFVSASNGAYGCYSVKYDSNRWMYHTEEQKGNLASLSYASKPARDGFDWQVQAVTALPVAIHADGFGSLVCPMAMSTDAPEGVTIYVDINGDNKLTETDPGKLIAPATPIYVYAPEASEVNLTVVNTGVEGFDYLCQYDAPACHLIKELEVAEGMTYYGKKPVAGSANVQRRAPREGSPLITLVKLDATDGKVTLPAGAAVMAVDGYSDSNPAPTTLQVSPTQGVPTSIDQINADEAGATAIFDLQGRRLAAPAKGINIINGTKVLIK